MHFTFNYTHYVPILKTKVGELNALEFLTENVTRSITPLLEATPIPPKWIEGEEEPIASKSIDDHVDWLVERIASAWTGVSPIFIDGAGIEEEDVLRDGLEPVEALLNDLAASKVSAIPVVGLDRSVEFIDSCKAFVKDVCKEVCVRLTQHDFEDLGGLTSNLDALLRHIDVSPKDTHLVLDFGSIPLAAAGILRSSLPYQIQLMPHVNDWRSFTIASSSFPSSLDMGSIGTYGLETFGRSEWDMWRQISNNKSTLPRVPTFADYATTHPAFSELDPRKIRVAPKIKYTDSLQWVIVKGEAARKSKDRKTPIPSEQYPRLAKILMNHPAWKDESFSWGDAQIVASAAGNGKNSATHWVTVGTVHHIACVVRQLASHHGL